MRTFSILRLLLVFIFILTTKPKVTAQEEPLFKRISEAEKMGVKFYEILCTKEGSVRLSSSIGLWKLKGHEINGPAIIYTGESTDNITGKKSYLKNFTNPEAEDSIRAMVEGPDSIFFYATQSNNLYYTPNGDLQGIGWPPFIFPPKGAPFNSRVSTLFIDNTGDLYIGTQDDNFYRIKEGANKESFKSSENKIVDSVMTIVKGEKEVKKIIIAPNTGVFSFAQDSTNKNIIWVGTNDGLYSYNKKTGESSRINPENVSAQLSLTITHIETDKQSNLWFSTLEKGMGFYYQKKNTMEFYPYQKKKKIGTTTYPIKTFCNKSENDFFVAVMDSLPAIFDKRSGKYAFIDDPSLRDSVNTTTDIKVDKSGNLLVIKAGALYLCKPSENTLLASAIESDTNLMAPFIRSVTLNNGEEIASINYKPELLKELKLKYNDNSILISYDVDDFIEKSKVQFAWKIDGYTDRWVIMPMLINSDSNNIASISDLKPGKYVFDLKVKVGSKDWRKQQARMTIIIAPPYWLTWWFWLVMIFCLSFLVYIIIKLRVRHVRKEEKVKAGYEKELMNIEAKALRAQMNPHFVFNCLNSIKALMQEEETEKGVKYLTTFSKLIRTLFNNADKKEISLYDEIETCRFYLQLEAMRFDAAFNYTINTDPEIDLKSVNIPALIIQPFIENAIWHGIVPGGAGGNIRLDIGRNNDYVEIIVEDDGIGREVSQQNKSNTRLTHDSKGVNLTQSRLELDNLLKQRHAKIEIIDKKDEMGNALGTKVIIKIQEETE